MLKNDSLLDQKFIKLQICTDKSRSCGKNCTGIWTFKKKLDLVLILSRLWCRSAYAQKFFFPLLSFTTYSPDLTIVTSSGTSRYAFFSRKLFILIHILPGPLQKLQARTKCTKHVYQCPSTEVAFAKSIFGVNDFSREKKEFIVLIDVSLERKNISPWFQAWQEMLSQSPEFQNCQFSQRNSFYVIWRASWKRGGVHLCTCGLKRIFAVQRVKSREVLEDDQRGKQLIAIQQEGNWKFLCFSGTLNTNLYVQQNRRTSEVRNSASL